MVILYWMYRLIIDNVDRGLVEKTIDRYYGRWLAISRDTSKYSYNIVLSKNCETKLVKPNEVIVCIKRESVKDIRRAIEYGRAFLRQWVTWDGSTYLLNNSGEPLKDYIIHPAFDIYIWREELEASILREKNIRVCRNPLIHKRFGGEHIVYSGPNPVARLKIPDQGIDFAVEQTSMDCNDNDLKLFIEKNRETMLRHVMIARSFLNSLGEPDHVLVSFSGGKDSLVVLDLAIKHYGSEMVTGVYVDTGVDFPSTNKYVDEVAEKLNVKIEKVYVPVKELIESKGLPSRTNRWCTLLKTRGFKKVLEKYREKYDKILVLVGDRDSESEARARKPPVRKRKKYLEAAPIKQWSTIHVQLYTWMNNLPENPLYKMGFYRLGCYICPALTSLEKHVMVRKLYDSLNNLPYFKEFVDRESRHIT